MAEQTPKPGAPKPPPRGFDGFEMTFVRERDRPDAHALPAPESRRSPWPLVLAALFLLLVVAAVLIALL